MKKIIFIAILFNIISLNLFGKYKYEDFYKTVNLSKCKSAREMLYTLENCHNVGNTLNSLSAIQLVFKISDYVDYDYYTIGAYKYLINYYNTGDEYTKELMQDIYEVCSNFRISGITSYKENKKYTSYEFAALLFNDSKEYTVDDYMDILNFGYKTDILIGIEIVDGKFEKNKLKFICKNCHATNIYYRCHKCGKNNDFISHEEKESDVSLAIKIISDILTIKELNKIILVSSDTDFIPVVNYVLNNTDKKITVLFPFGSSKSNKYRYIKNKNYKLK